TRAGSGAARRAAPARARRAGKRPRPRRHPLVADVPARVCGRWRDRAPVEPCPVRGRPDRRPGGDHRSWPARGQPPTRRARRWRRRPGSNVSRPHLGGRTVIAQVRAELLKQTTIRTGPALLVALLALVALAIVLHAVGLPMSMLAPRHNQLM